MDVNRTQLYAAGTATGLSLDALWRFLSSVNWATFLNLAGCVVATSLSWYAAYRQTLREQRAKDRETERQEYLANELLKLRLERERSGPRRISRSDSP